MAKKLRKVNKGASENATMYKETKKAVESINENILKILRFKKENYARI